MKFFLKSKSKSCARLGVINSIGRLPDFELETPATFLYTKEGTIPHVTHEVLQKITKKDLGLYLPIPGICQLGERVAAYKKSLAEFIGMKEYIAYCTPVDAGEKQLEGFHQKGLVKFNTRHGQKQITAESYMSLIKELKPELFVTLCDCDTTRSSSKKRIIKSAVATANMFDKCLDAYEHSENLLKSSKIIGALVGGYDMEVREQCSKVVGGSSVFGVTLEGLHNYCSEEMLKLNIDDVKDAINASLKYIPNDKLRIINGCWSPRVVLDLISMGIDVLDTTYPYFITEKGGALIFPNDDCLLEPQSQLHSDKKVTLTAGDMQNNGFYDDTEMHAINGAQEPALKKLKTKTNSYEEEKYVMSLRESGHAENFSPISEKCSCLTCTEHTRAYIHHLLTVNEMLGPLMLMIHNVHHYLQFMSTIRKALKNDRFEEMKKNFDDRISTNNNI